MKTFELTEHSQPLMRTKRMECTNQGAQTQALSKMTPRWWLFIKMTFEDLSTEVYASTNALQRT